MTPLTEVAREIFQQALEDCNIQSALARKLSVWNGKLRLMDDNGTWQEWLDFSALRHLRIIAVGKAASSMLTGLLNELPWPSDCDLSGVLIAPEPPNPLTTGVQYFRGGHPLPNQASFAGAQAALALLRSLAPEELSQSLCIFLLSGGASAMMELPLEACIGVDETAAFHNALIGSGASIGEMNCVRKHFSAVKGGRLGLAAGDCRCLSLFISDVPEGQLDVIGSGPTMPDSSTVTQCREILTRYRLLDRFPASIRDFFASDSLPETPREVGPDAQFHVLLKASDLTEAAAGRARALGWHTVVDNTCDEWDYKAAAHYLLKTIRNLRTQFPRVCLISGGELAVRLPANPVEGRIGLGGRNQQFALFAATILEPADGPVAILSAGSDGIDGNCPAAGAVIDETILAPQDHPSACRALADHDSYTFLSERGLTIHTGPTGQNLRDLRILLVR